MSNELKFSNSAVIIENLTIDNAELAEYLSEFENPVEAFCNLIQIALDVRSRLMTDLETQTIEDSVYKAVESIESIYAKMIKDLQEALEELVDPNTGPVIQALDKATGENLKKLLNPEFNHELVDQSPIARLRGLINEEIKKVVDDIGAIKTKLGLTGNPRVKTTFDGVDFEGQVDWEIQKLAKIFGDTAQSVGDTPEEGGRAKKGDSKVILNFDDTNGHTAVVIWEAKTASSFKSDAKNSPKVKDDQVRKALNEAMNLRNAQVGVFVIDSSGLDMNAQPSWREYEGNKLLLVLDTINPEPEIIRVGYLWSRWKAKAALGKIDISVDSEGIENVIKQIILKLDDLRKIKQHNKDAISHLNLEYGLISGFYDQTRELMKELASMISVKVPEVPNFED